MAVNEHVGMFGGEPAGRFELGFRRGDSEAWRDRVVQAAAPIPFFDQGRGIAVPAVRGVAQVLRAVAVHQYFARDHAQVARLGLREESVDRTRMHGAEYQRSGGAVAHQFVEKEAGDLRGVLRVGKKTLGRKRVIVEPIEQLRGIGRDHVGLWIVDVRVDETRHQQMARVVHDLHVRRQCRQ